MPRFALPLAAGALLIGAACDDDAASDGGALPQATATADAGAQDALTPGAGTGDGSLDGAPGSQPAPTTLETQAATRAGGGAGGRTEGSDAPAGGDFPDAGEWLRVEADGVSFEVPKGWQETEEHTWAHPNIAAGLAFASGQGAPPAALSSMLPVGADTVGEEDLTLEWAAEARMYTLEIAADGVGTRYERHAVARVDDRLYDWSIAAIEQSGLDDVQAVLDHALESVERTEG